MKFLKPKVSSAPPHPQKRLKKITKQFHNLEEYIQNACSGRLATYLLGIKSSLHTHATAWRAAEFPERERFLQPFLAFYTVLFLQVAQSHILISDLQQAE